MKKNLVFILFLPLVLLFSCTSLDDVNERLDEHEKRLNALETLVTNANTTISNLQKLVDAQGNKVSVVSYEMLADGSGYVLKMSDGTDITLKNGSDGDSPSVGVKEVDGILYWTINGEVMRDADGNPVKAEGEDGATGQTPKIRVNTDGEWEVSLDGGKTWQAVLDENGDPVSAIGSGAQIDLVITEDENSITIIYDGETFVIPKGDGGNEPEPEKEYLVFNFATSNSYSFTVNSTCATGFYFSSGEYAALSYILPGFDETNQESLTDMLYYLYPFEGEGIMTIDCVDGEQPSWAEIPIDVMSGTKYFAIAADKDANGDIQGEVSFITFRTK
ncbi:MAG TPA: hypothetical protein GX746_01965 [Bacteroidales bacterium]|nr:hypothetical protein [Bacteroidales bacterium]